MTSKARNLANLIADGAIGTSEIADGAVTTPKLGDAQVTDAKIAGLNASKLSGDVATARLGSGTASSTTFLRGDRTWQTIETTPTTAQVLAATAGASAGAVGTYAFLCCNPPTLTIEPGNTRAGSGLNWSAATEATAAGSPSGTWRIMGRVANIDFSTDNTTLWLRIS